MWTLALESVTAHGSLSLLKDNFAVSVRESIHQKQHSEFFHPALAEILAEQQLQLRELDLICVDRGPGSFTGLRVCGNIGRTLSYSLNKPLITVDSLSVLAQGTRAVPSSAGVGTLHQRPVLSLINAFKNMVFFCIFDVHGEFVEPRGVPEVTPVTDLESLLGGPLGQEEFLCVGDGFTIYQRFFPDSLRARMGRHKAYIDFPHSTTLGQLGLRVFRATPDASSTYNWKSYSPLYIRASAAEENAENKTR
jgi:N6-L-threonylcarbamoyladenine synthase/tRNA threonylcarbamoyladenosine biosynthesis protein TsaB